MSKVDKAISAVMGVKVYIFVGLACFAFGVVVGATAMGKLKDGKIAEMRAEVAEARAKAATDALKRTQGQAAVTSQNGRQAADAQVRIETRYRTLREKVSIYVPKETPPGVIRADDAVPVGALILLDAAARGDKSDAVSVTRGASYELASPVHFAQLVDGYVANLGIGTQNARQMSDLQDWIRKQQALDQPPH